MFEFPIAVTVFAIASLIPTGTAPNCVNTEFANTATKTPSVEGIEWSYGSFDSALENSAQKAGLTMIYFWADGSDFCGKLYTETLSKSEAATATDGIVCYSAKHSTETAKLFKRYSITTLPTILFVRPDGTPEDVITGFIPVDEFGKQIARIRKAEGTRSGIMTQLQGMDPASEAALETRWLLISKLQELGLTDAESEHTAKLIELDPEGNSTPGGTLKFNALTSTLFSSFASLSPEEAQAALQQADFSPLYNFAKTCKNRNVRFNAWSTIARAESNRKNFSAAKAAIAKSLHDIQDENRANWCNAIAGWVVTNAEQVSSKERKYALSLAQRSVKMTKAYRKKAGGKSSKPSASDLERSNDTLAQRICVLAQVEFLNRKRDKARKSIAEAGHLVEDETLAKEIAEVAHKLAGEK